VQSLSEIRALLAQRGLHPSRRLGQHFLHDKNQLARLVDAAAIAPGELVLEVGPGTGTLTEALLETGAEVVCSEVDRGLAEIVRERFGDRVRLVVGDCLRRKTLAEPLVEALADRPFVLVSNLPYQVASTLVGTVLLDHPACRALYVTIQKEVADRLIATPGTKAYGPLTVIVALLAEVRLLATLKPTCFWPAPEVESAMVAIVRRPAPEVAQPHDVVRFAVRLFSMRRKQLKRILGAEVSAWPEGIQPTNRPEQLSPEQIVELWQVHGAHGRK
jgi:16S rRNA (adenine1518-N6/adenine1519-N6)-dimethyltransferase